MCGSRGAESFGTARAHIPLRGIMPRRSLRIPSPIHVLQSILRVRSTASDAKSPTPLRRYEAGSPLSLNNHHSTTTQQNEMGAGKEPRRYRSLMDAKYAASVWAINCLPRSSLCAASRLNQLSGLPERDIASHGAVVKSQTCAPVRAAARRS